MKNLIDEQLKEAQKKMDEVRCIDEEYKEVCNQEAEVQNDVNNFFKAIHDCLEEKKKNMLAEMRDQAVRSRAQLKRQKNAYSESRRGDSIRDGGRCSTSDAHHKC